MAVQTPFMPLVLAGFGVGVFFAAYQTDTTPAVSGANPVPVCGSGVRYTCVVDGDTLWFKGEKIRLLGIDTPEMNGKCRAERMQALHARDALVKLVSNATIKVRRSAVDRYGRTLAKVYANDIGVGEALITQDLARRWDGRRRSWC